MSAQVGAVGVGLAVLGISSFGYLAITSRQLGPAAVAPLTTLWVLINAIGPALFFPLEQEVGRAVAARRALGLGSRPVVARAALLGLALLTGLVAVCLLAGAPLSDGLFGGQLVVVAALVLGSAGLCLEHLSRGVFAGNGQFLRYGAQLGVDGTLRLLGAVVLIAVGSTQVGWYAVLLAAAPVIAVILTAPRPRRLTQPGPPASWRDLGSALGLLVAGSACSQFVINAAPVAANLLAGTADQARVGVFISVLVFARMPLFVFAALQAVLLPGLARLAALGDLPGFRRRLLRILGLVGGFGVAGVVALAVIGPWLVRLVFGAQFQTTRAVLVPLAVAAAAYMIALVLSQALISVRGYRESLTGWAVGCLAFLLALVVPLELELRVGYAFVAATVASVTVLGGLLLLRLRHSQPAGAG